MPTWFCSRDWFRRVGTFDEGGKGVPEDLLWFYQSVGQGGGVVRVDQCLLVYRYHQQAATHSVLEETIWNLRVAFLQERVIKQWESFTIWNAGKQGRKLYRCLSSFNQKKVCAFSTANRSMIFIMCILPHHDNMELFYPVIHHDNMELFYPVSSDPS
uniref:UDP-GlcNAc:betaGal beta-1,3-N-acetylglucosaminyltransferase-like 1 n=1 Tax=Hucho hucho TaxID=62062 RepID=A0A4W5MAR4_9TELE